MKSSAIPLLSGGGGIFLIGFMGSGKTHWGRVWAEQYDIPFYDLDTLIEEKENKTVTKIFEQQGERYFRERETEFLKIFSAKDNFILACGGGAPCFNNNMKLMNESGHTIYLSAKPQYIYDHVIAEKDKRPLLKNINPAELLFFIEQKIKERQPFYEQAKIILPVTTLNAASLSTI
jgi:shikimate kinase